MLRRLLNVFRRDRVAREIEEELQSHLEEAMENGRSPDKFGSTLRIEEASREWKLVTWLDALVADAVFGWRQLMKNRTVTAAAVLSLALAIGSSTAAFRLIDALLLRPLPVDSPERLRFIATEWLNERTGKLQIGDGGTYPLFRLYRDAVKDQAQVLAISHSGRMDITYSTDAEMEQAYRQYVSGEVFPAFGLKPALGRLLGPADNEKASAHPYAVLSYEYWTRRFGRDPKVIGKTFREGSYQLQIIGVLEPGFTGTEPGAITDYYIPATMNAKALDHAGWSWFRAWVKLNPGVREEEVRERIQAARANHQRERAKGWPSDIPRERVEREINQPVKLLPASAGVSGMQREYRQALFILAGVVGLVLLIASANVANLLTAQAAARAREMALRVSIGAGRLRLVQLMLIESGILAAMATVLGTAFAWWSAPLVVSMLGRRDAPIRLVLDFDWRVLAFVTILTVSVAFLFGLIPALRASSIKPAAALKGGEDPHGKRRLMNALVAVQVAFCFLVHFAAGLFVATFDRLSRQPTGFQVERVLALETAAKDEQSPEVWAQIADHLRGLSQVESAALCGWAPMSGSTWTNDIFVGGRRSERSSPYFLRVGPGWFDTMKVQLIAGRDFRANDVEPSYDGKTKQVRPGVAIVNETFAQQFYGGESPVGRTFENPEDRDIRVPVTIVGYMRDWRYRDPRDTARPVVLVPAGKDQWSTIMVRTRSDNPLTLAAMLRAEVQKARPEFRVSNVQTQTEIVERHTVRERMLAILSLFFAGVALILAGVGLYGVLSYAVLQRRREIGIRMALGAQPSNVVTQITRETFAMLALGSLVGLAAGVASERFVDTLLFGVKATDIAVLTVPLLTLLAAALLAALPPTLQAVRVDPAQALRSE